MAEEKEEKADDEPLAQKIEIQVSTIVMNLLTISLWKEIGEVKFISWR